MKVLFCTDGSEASFYVIKKTLPFLKPDCQLDIINVIDWGFFPTYVTFPYEEETGLPNQKSVSQEILHKTRDFINSFGYKVTNEEHAMGFPADIILQAIIEDDYDLVCLGSHGKKGIDKWLGSVSRKVVTKSPISTLIARPSEEPAMPEIKKQILVATDGSIYSYNAIKKAIEILDMKNSSIEILTVTPGPESLPVEITMDNEWLENSLLKQKEVAKEILEESEKIFNNAGINIKTAFSLEGDSAEIILQYTEKNPKDLIIMGSHGREGISDILLGSVSKRVLDNASSPVLIVPSQKSINES